jgi:hypothetical protein
MTDARYPSHWMHDARIQALSGDHFRALMHALAWCATNRTDGLIRPDDLPLIYRVDAHAITAFIAAGLCAELDDGWLLTEYLATQTSRAEFEASDRARLKARQRKAEQRAKQSAAQRHVTQDVTQDVAGYSTGKARQGKARQGF